MGAGVSRSGCPIFRCRTRTPRRFASSATGMSRRMGDAGIRFPRSETCARASARDGGSAVTALGRETSVGALVRVDLGPLQPAGEVHVDGLPLGEDLDPGDARLPVAVPRVLDSAEGQVDFRAD